jgi:anaerobic selenocysteine-containing dehydrogenase
MVADYGRIRDKIEAVFPDFYDYNARIRHPGGFRLRVGASNREWDTPDGKAHFNVHRGTDEDNGRDDGPLTLTTIRSHDQYNTTIYGLDDRYRGVFGRRDVIFMNKDDLAKRGLVDGAIIDVESLPTAGGRLRAARGLLAVEYNIPRGSVAGYYPEMNALIALSDYDRLSGTPAYKGVPVVIKGAQA